MAYYIDIFSPETYEAFTAFGKNISGFRHRYKKVAQKIKPGDKFICYMTKLSRWVGVLEVLSDYFEDDTPKFLEHNDPFVIRFKVQAIAWLEKEKAIPIKEDLIWKKLSFTKDRDKNAGGWTGKFRASLSILTDVDGKFLEEEITSQMDDGNIYPVDEEDYHNYIKKRIRRPDGFVSVSVPQDVDELEKTIIVEKDVRESTTIQAKIAAIGERMGYSIWIPKRDRSNVYKIWKPANEKVLLEQLPLNYDEVTLTTIENIDVIWLLRRSIVRAFEVEHTTSIYSGILRMADLLALQPNMDIKLHIVAPYEKRDKVFHELQRPVFSLLDKGPLSELCTYLSYDSLSDLSNVKHLEHLSDSVLDEYEEIVE